MTTATDWDVTDTETGEHPVVTDVTSAATDAPVLTAEHALILRQHNTELAGKVGTLSADVLNLRAENRRLQAELDRRGWLPTAEQMRDADQREIESAADLTEREYTAGLYRPPELDDTDRDGMPLHTIGSSDTWPTWLGELHHADATVAEHITDLRSWAEGYIARPVERTVVEPVAVDYSYRQTDAALYAAMVVSAAEEHVASVYDELAPERIQDSPADVSGQNREATPPSTGSGAGPSSPVDWPERQPSPPGATIEISGQPDDRVERMKSDPETYFREARERASALAPLAQQPEPEPEPERRKPWWRREWAAAAGIVVLWAAAMAALVVLA